MDMAYIISADEIKKTPPGYEPALSESFHAESARLADKAYERALKERPEKAVIVMAGGTASGKTEYVAAYFRQRRAIVFDGTLPTLEGAKIKIRKALKAGKRPEIHLVLPASLFDAFRAFLDRGRKFSPTHFYRTHSGSRKTVLELAKEHPDLPIKISISTIVEKASGLAMVFSDEIFSDRERLIEYLRENLYNEEEIINKILRS